MTRRWIPALATAGAALGAAAGLATSEPHRAATTLAAEIGGAPVDPAARAAAKPVMPTLAELAVGDIVVGNVVQAEHLRASDVRTHLHVRVPSRTSLLVLTYDARSEADAARVVQQAATVLTSVVSARFGGGSRPLSVSVVEPVQSVNGPTRPVLWYALLGLLAGAVSGALIGGQRRHRPAAAPAPAAPPDSRAAIRARVEAFAPPVRPEARDRQTGAPASPPPRPVAASSREVPGEPPPVGSRGWNIDDLERRTRAAGGPSLEERLAYVVALRPQARDGVLGVEYDAIVHEVFGELIE